MAEHVEVVRSQPPHEFSQLHDLGWELEFVTDEPGKVYEPHSHEKTILHTVSGDMRIRIKDSETDTWSEWSEQHPGDTFVVEEGHEHEAIVGSKGWGYWATWDPEAAKAWSH